MSNLMFNVYDRAKDEKAKVLIKKGQVPCIIYGDGLKESIPVKIEKNELIKLMNSNTQSSLIPLVLNGQTTTCIVKELQKSVYGKVIHIDFQAVSANEVVKLKIPVNFVGMDNLEIKRLVLETFTPELEVHGIMAKMPETLEVNVSNMNFEDKIFAKDIKLPDDISLMTEPETLLAVIAGSDNNSEDDDEEAATEE